MVTMKLSENYLLSVTVRDSGVPGMDTLEMYQQFPLAQHPRQQRILQLTLPPGQLFDITQAIRDGVARKVQNE